MTVGASCLTIASEVSILHLVLLDAELQSWAKAGRKS